MPRLAPLRSKIAVPPGKTLEHSKESFQRHVDGMKSLGLTQNMGVTVVVEAVTLREALTRILQPYKGLSFKVDGNRIIVGPEKPVDE